MTHACVRRWPDELDLAVPEHAVQSLVADVPQPVQSELRQTTRGQGDTGDGAASHTTIMHTASVRAPGLFPW